MDTSKRIEQAVQLGVKTHLAFRKHTEERVRNLQENLQNETSAQSPAFFLEAEYNRLQHQFRSSLMALRQGDPENYNKLVLRVTQEVQAWMRRYDALEVSERIEDRRRSAPDRKSRRLETRTPQRPLRRASVPKARRSA